jgi:hypothetical protein
MTRLYLAAGVAALAIAAPATAGPGGHGGGRQDAQAAPQRGGGGAVRAQRVQNVQAPRVQRQAFSAPRAQRQSFSAPRAQRQSFAAPRVQQQRFAAVQRPQRVDRTVTRPARADRQQARATRVQQAPTRVADRQQTRANRVQQVQANRAIPTRDRTAARQQVQANRTIAVQDRTAARQQLQGNNALAVQNRFASRNALATQRIDRTRAFAPVAMTVGTQSTRVLPVGQAVTYVGQPVAALGGAFALSAMPQAASYLYPDTSNYYYQYGDGYAYQIDRGSSLISALIPLLAGGYMPGQYLPSSYMNSYAPDYYGFNSFYPASTPYGCNRYMNGVVYQVDCLTGMVENVVPLYASGYGVGQMLPSSYDYYNVPYQYRDMYPASNNYRYAPGAIYQYDPSSSLITSVASLLSPGFAVGQQLPMGYSAYNVPYGYRQTYYDTPNALYRYNNGYIYQVDPATQLVSAIVASALI